MIGNLANKALWYRLELAIYDLFKVNKHDHCQLGKQGEDGVGNIHCLDLKTPQMIDQFILPFPVANRHGFVELVGDHLEGDKSLPDGQVEHEQEMTAKGWHQLKTGADVFQLLKSLQLQR